VLVNLIPRVDSTQSESNSDVLILAPRFRSAARSVTILTVMVHGESGKSRSFDVELSPAGGVSIAPWPETPIVAAFDVERPAYDEEAQT
jgi:hypothetical protein